MLYSGIDLHKRSVVIATAVARYFQWLPEPTVATVESTSSWYWLCDLFE